MARRESFLERMLGGQQAKDQRERETRNVEAHILRQARLRANLDRVRAEDEQNKTSQEQTHTRRDADLRDQNESLEFHLSRLADVLRRRQRGLATTPDLLAATFRHGGADAFARAVQDDLSASPYPPSLPTRTTVLAYRPDARELIVERDLPGDSVIPLEQGYRMFKGRVLPVPRRAADVQHLYGQLLARIVLRTVAETFSLIPAALVDRVVLRGRVSSVDRATGDPSHLELVNVQFSREPFERLPLDAPELDPELCLRRHDARVAPPQDRASQPDLLTLPPVEFESLVRRLFQARGLRAWRTQASRDDGLDAVAVNEDPVLGGVAIIQAKRYSRVVPAEAVRALASAMADQRAAKGILVTTSWVGRDSVDFAHRNGRIQIIEGRQLKQMLAETLNLNVRISLPTLPQGWDRTQVA